MELWCWFVVMASMAMMEMDALQNACNTWTQRLAYKINPKPQV